MSDFVYFLAVKTALESSDVYLSQETAVSLRESIDSLKVVVKFKNENVPMCLMNKGFGPYNREEAQAKILSDTNWTPSDPFPGA